VALINSAKNNAQNPMLRETGRAWFIWPLRHPARKRSGSILPGLLKQGSQHVSSAIFWRKWQARLSQ